MNRILAEEMALFKYGLIAPIIHEDGKGQMKYFRNMAEKTYKVPGKKKEQRYSISSFKNWLREYRKGGIEALLPSTRSDKGISKKITTEMHTQIETMLEQYPHASVSALYRLMVKQGILTHYDFTEGTLRNYIRDNNLREPKRPKTERKKFEVPAVNMIWTTDFMHGPRVTVSTEHNKKKKAYLCAIIDDHSRLIVGARFFLEENTIALATVFKKSILQYGLPEKFYCDNGSVFSSGYLNMACARIKVALIHSKPYDSPSRGKIERFFRTVRDKFLSVLPPEKLRGIDSLNESFTAWLKDEYNHHMHSGIDQTPIQKYMNSLNSISIKRLSEHELNLYFYNSIERVVKNDSTVSIKKVLYEVPSKFIGSKVEIRFPLDEPDKMTLYDNGQPFYQIKKVNLTMNSDKPYTAIRFSNINQNKEED